LWMFGARAGVLGKVTWLHAVVLAALLSQASPGRAAGEGPGTVPLIKLEYPGNPPNIRMLYVRLLALGDRKVDQPLLFDTGSAGMTVECPSFFPPICAPMTGSRSTRLWSWTVSP
jgi:hypothetical protein